MLRLLCQFIANFDRHYGWIQPFWLGGYAPFSASELKKHQISDGKVHRNKPGRLSDAEVITILILFHCKGFWCLKHL